GAAAPSIIREHAGFAAHAAGTGVSLLARTSRDGGATWSKPSAVAHNVSFGPPGIRCCLDSVSGDPVRGRMYAVWQHDGPGEPVMLSSSADGRHWSAPRPVTHSHKTTIQHVNEAVAAYNGKVFVSYGTRNTAVHGGNLVQQ